MMQVRSVGVTLAITVVVSAVTSFLFGRLSVGRAGDVVPAPDAAELKMALRDVERSLADIRQLLAAQPPGSAPRHDPAPELQGRPAGPSRPASGGDSLREPSLTAPRAAPAAGPQGDMLPAADLTRAEEIHEWGNKEDVRRRWFIVSESDALAVFGTPTHAWEWGSGEQWQYVNDEWNLTLCFLRGRLVNVQARDKRQR